MHPATLLIRTVYKGYLKAANGLWLVPALLLFAVLMQTAQVMSTVWITWWESRHFGGTQGFYMGVFAALGVSQ
jgi:ATP-binding cassette subfamily C (CFTR/MRP) protein 1